MLRSSLLPLVLLAGLLGGCPSWATGPEWPGGIGAVLRHSASTGRLVVADVPPGGPAAQAGLRSDDRIVAIDGRLVADLSLAEVLEALHGEVASTVTLRVLRGEEELALEVERAPYRDAEE